MSAGFSFGFGFGFSGGHGFGLVSTLALASQPKPVGHTVGQVGRLLLASGRNNSDSAGSEPDVVAAALLPAGKQAG